VPEPQHFRARKGDIAERVVVSGDPARVVQLSRLLKHSRMVNEYRGFVAYTGEYGRKRFTFACHGIGGPSAAIVIEELAMLGARTIVRLGTCGGVLKSMQVGDLVVATRAGYLGGTLDYYFKEKRQTTKPDNGLTELLIDSIKDEGVRYYVGPVFSTDAFYAEGTGFASKKAAEGYKAVEMECATVFGVGMLRGIRTACVLIVADNLLHARPMADAEALEEQVAGVGKLVLRSLSRASP